MKIFKILKNLFKKPDSIFYSNVINITKYVLGISVPINATTMAKVKAAEMVKQEIKNKFIIPKTKNTNRVLIIFSTDINNTIGNDLSALNTIDNFLKLKWQILINKVKEKFTIINTVDINYRIGNFFKGKYLDNYNKMYNEKSVSIYIENVTSEFLKKLAGLIAKEFNQETILVEDNNVNKILIFA